MSETSLHHLTREQVIALLEERDTLREQVRQLEDLLAPCAVFPQSWRLCAQEYELLRAIRAVGPNVLQHQRAIVTLYGMWEDAPCQKSFEVMLCKIRRKLIEAQAQFTIETVWGRGWRMTPKS